MQTERRILLAVAALAAALGPFAARAEGVLEVPMRDPWIPPAVREKSLAAPQPSPGGAELRAQVERKLRERFDAAVRGAPGLTRDEARAAGLGAIAAHFEAIDRRGTGIVTFDDYKRFLKSRGAALD